MSGIVSCPKCRMRFNLAAPEHGAGDLICGECAITFWSKQRMLGPGKGYRPTIGVTPYQALLYWTDQTATQ